MKVLITTDTYYPHVNGCSYFAQRLAFYLKRSGHDVLIIAPSKNLRGGFYTYDGIRVFALPSIPFPYNNFSLGIPFFIADKIRAVIRAYQPDIVHAQGHFPISKAVLKIIKELGITAVGTNHFMPENLTHYLHLPKRAELAVQKFMWEQFRKVFEELHTVTAPTQTAVNLASKYRFSKIITPVSNGIDTKRFHPGLETTAIKKKYQLPDAPTLLFVGRLDKEKNVDLLLRAFAIATRDAEFHFVIAGNGVLKKNLQKLTAKLGLNNKVTFAGFVPDAELAALYCAVDCFAIAGTAELQSIVTMEAMASGLPVVGVDAVALPELIHHGENGLLFEPEDVRAAAHAMRTILGDPALRQQMGQKSLEIVSRHSIDQTIETYEGIYRKALAAQTK